MSYQIFVIPQYCINLPTNKNPKIMKKTCLLLMVFALTIACKSEQKSKKDYPETGVKEIFIAKPEATSVKWIAYKTTEKNPVKGGFTTLNFDPKTGQSPKEALNDLVFSIPVSSIFSNDENRDSKIKQFFFRTMLDTDLIKGILKYTDDKLIASITMNGVTRNLPLEVKITDRKVSMTGTMLLKNWGALDALESLTKACFELHKGPDGISKTWDEIDLQITTVLGKK